MIDLLVNGDGKDWQPLLQTGERALDAVPLCFGGQAGQHVAEVRMPGARVDVLPAICSEERCLDRARLARAQHSAAIAPKVGRVRGGLFPQDRVDGRDQVDEVIDSLVALLRGQAVVRTQQLQLIEDRVLAFLLPMEEEYVLEQLG